ncbi:hypothetical protein T440DRAFT_402873, partial [Plenodomus tracheiphilus IPT5]
LTTMSSSQQNNNGGRPTGATGGGHHRNTCRNYQQPGHPPQYMFVDLPGALCAHCQTTRPAETDSISHAVMQLHNEWVYLLMDLGVLDLVFLVLAENVACPTLHFAMRGLRS